MWMAPTYLPVMRFLVIQHLDIEPPALIGEIVQEAGHELCFAHMTHGDTLPEDTHDLAGVIIMGGPQSANDRHLPYISGELAWLGLRIGEGMPMLGICLGAQLMASAAGANISASPLRELGWRPVFPTQNTSADPLFSSLPASGLAVFQWHGESFSLPEGGKLMATHPVVPTQAFRLGRAQYGLQFHVEVDASIIAEWIMAGGGERTHLGIDGIKELHKGTHIYLQAMREFCRRMTHNWLKLAEAFRQAS